MSFHFVVYDVHSMQRHWKGSPSAPQVVVQPRQALSNEHIPFKASPDGEQQQRSLIIS